MVQFAGAITSPAGKVNMNLSPNKTGITGYTENVYVFNAPFVKIY